MRADRLLTLLMLLQRRGRMTAAELAHELEVSERTIYRDIDALSLAGVPVYAERGPGGGCALLENYRTTLTGLDDAEVRALFMLSIPAPLAQLGIGRELRAALLKLAAALPAARREREARMRQRVHLDSTPWFSMEGPSPHLQLIHRAVQNDLRLRITYRLWFGPVETTVDPYGLVAKTDIWYLVAAREGITRIYRLSDISAVEVLDECFDCPADFDLAAFWVDYCGREENARPSYPVTLRVSPDLLRLLPLYLAGHAGERSGPTGMPDAQGWTTLTLAFESFHSARERVLSFGGAAEVIAPEALRLSVADFAGQILSRYQAVEPQ